MAAAVDEMSIRAQKLFNLIDKIVVRRGRLKKDEITWDFHINGAVLEIPAEKVEMQGCFRSQYIREFETPAPFIKSEEWVDLINCLVVMKKESAEDVEQSDDEYLALRVFEEVCKFPISDNKELADQEKCLYPMGEEFVAIKSKKIEEIVNDTKFKFCARTLSEAMTQLGFKAAGSDRLYIKKQERVWKFYRKAVLKEIGEGIV
jgi:hypothetical protein